jgi:hypothetical protein
MESPPLLIDHRNNNYRSLKCHSNFSLSTVSPYSTGQKLRGRFTPGASSGGLRVSTASGSERGSSIGLIDGTSLAPACGTDSGQTEWRIQRLLARIHCYTLNRLRKEIEPVSPADFMRFLLTWQRVAPGDRGEGPESLSAILDQLEWAPA